MTYFHVRNLTLSLARCGFTSEFEKGSGGSRTLWLPGKLTFNITLHFTLSFLGEGARRAGEVFHSPRSLQVKSALNNLTQFIDFSLFISSVVLTFWMPAFAGMTKQKHFGCYMIKPHGQLVLVSFMHYCTSTSSLSTL